jgi:hypothetical protein
LIALIAIKEPPVLVISKTQKTVGTCGFFLLNFHTAATQKKSVQSV